MTTKTLDLNLVSKGTPHIWGSVQNTLPFTFVYAAAPFISVDKPSAQITTFVYDSLGRLNQASFPSGRQTVYNLDAAGNRTSVVTS